mgnify:CR=1 FL=1
MASSGSKRRRLPSNALTPARRDEEDGDDTAGEDDDGMPPADMRRTKFRCLDGTNDIPAFLANLYEMLNEPKLAGYISWGGDGTTVCITDSTNFATIVLPRYFKTSTFASFTRQLNAYGFHKVRAWEATVSRRCCTLHTSHTGPPTHRPKSRSCTTPSRTSLNTNTFSAAVWTCCRWCAARVAAGAWGRGRTCRRQRTWLRCTTRRACRRR